MLLLSGTLLQGGSWPGVEWPCGRTCTVSAMKLSIGKCMIVSLSLTKSCGLRARGQRARGQRARA